MTILNDKSKVTIKKYWWIVLVLITLIIIGVQRCQNNKLNDELQLKDIQLSVLQDSVKIVKTDNGNLVFKIKAVELEKDNTIILANKNKKELEAAGFTISELRNENIKWRDVNFALSAQLQAIGSGTIVLHDSININKPYAIMPKVGSWTNGFLSLYPLLSNDTLKFDYGYQTRIKVIGETNKTITFGLTDPKASITNANALIIPKKKAWWGWNVIKIGGSFALGACIFK